ncbi:MAG: hypothetical protein ACE5ID_09070, partial [Acidobacteriota bacterium]
VEGVETEPARVTLADSTQPVAWTREGGSRRLVLPLASGGLQVQWKRPSALPGLSLRVLAAAAAGLILLILVTVLLVNARRRSRRAQHRP